MKMIHFPFLSLLALFTLLPLHAGDVPAGLTDPGWTHGTLDNGLRYFIRPNAKPENRLELRLVVDAGSVLEAEDQQGLAHYLEHVAFLGTENFEHNEMIRFLESLGVGFGPDLNAYTSFDETVYRLRLPTEDPETVATGFLILSDWAGRVIASDEAIASERGVIIEEWRGRRGGAQRVRDLKIPLIFYGSRYAERLPIGDIDVIRNFDFDRLRDFYRDWYRPDLMSVVAVGDLDVEETRERIQELFGGFTMPGDAPERPAFPLPEHSETKVGVFSDPELTSSTLALFWKHPYAPVRDENDYRKSIRRGLVTDMLNRRFSEISQRAEAPFLRAGVFRGTYTRATDVFMLHAAVDDTPGAHTRAMRALLEETERARVHGFTDLELARAVRRRMRGIERAYNERENTEHTEFVNNMIRHALEGVFVPGIERELELHREELPQVTPDELREMLSGWIRPVSRVVLADGPSRDGAHNLPGEDELAALFDPVDEMDLVPWADGLGDVPLVETAPEPGGITARREIPGLGMYEWTLSNGARVLLKPTEFKRDQVLLSAWSPRGHNHLPLEDLPHARAADNAVISGGLAGFSAVELRNLLSGQLVSLTPSIGGEQTSLGGSASPQDLETLFQLVWLHFTAPREDPDAFEAFRRRRLESVRNRQADPRGQFNDLISETMTRNHPRLQPMTPEEVQSIRLERALEIYRKAFGNAADFTFMFTGAFTPEDLEPLATRWLASLPAEGPALERLALDVRPPRHQMRVIMREGIEPISEVHMAWTSEAFEHDYANRHAVQSMTAALRIRLREEIREARGGTYHISVWPSFTDAPAPRVQMNIRFGCDPEQVEPLIEAVYAELETFTTQPLDDSYIHTVRETQRRRREVDLTRNEFWNNVLPFYEWHGEDPRVVLAFDDYVSAITAEGIRDTAKRYFNVPDHAQFILMPSEKDGETDGEADGEEGERD